MAGFDAIVSRSHCIGTTQEISVYVMVSIPCCMITRHETKGRQVDSIQLLSLNATNLLI